MDVDAAFALMDAVAMKKAEDEAAAKSSGEPLGFTFPLDVLPLYRREVQAAKKIIRRAAYTKREIRRGDFPEAV